MGDLIRGAGSTFQAGDTVTAAKLHALVDNATLKPGVVTGEKIADGAVSQAKLQPGMVFPAGALQVPEGNVVLGNGSNVGVPLPVGPTLTKTGALNVADGSIVEAKIADGAVATAKIASVTPSPAGVYGAAGTIPVVTVNEKGQVISVSTVAVQAQLTKLTLEQKDVPTAPGHHVLWTFAATAAPLFVDVWAECISPDAGHLVGDRVPITAFFRKSGDEAHPAFGVRSYAAVAGSWTVQVVAFGQDVQLLNADTGARTNVLLSAWKLRASVMI